MASKPHVILVTGSRAWKDAALLEEFLLREAKGRPLVRIVHGGAKGADQLAHKLAVKQGWQYKVYAPDWHRLGRAAGLQRNTDMLKAEKHHVDVVFAFPTKESKGTWDMVGKARKAGVRVVICPAK
jgi:peptidoglycan/xylan/chitin deacetylase (PgdA/CDA1 family)